jgi:ribosome-binding protein aMBF1 (putative translation factor)
VISHLGKSHFRIEVAAIVRLVADGKSHHSRSYLRLTRALREASETSGLTQAQVAQKLGADASFISKIESGERRIDVVELRQLCGVDKLDLVGFLRSAGLCE